MNINYMFATISTAAWHAVSLCVDHGFQQVVFEGDSMVVVSALNQTTPSWCSHGQLIENTKEKVPSLHRVKIIYASRVVNLAAHILAKYAISQLLDEVWMNECHS